MEIRPDLLPPPLRIAKLPVSPSGYPVPWFVAFIDGKPDFRCIGPGKLAEAHNKKLCWICGEPRGVYLAFVIGPMCAINRVSSEPPGHRECAEYSACACPFLTRPKVERRENNLPPLAPTPAAELPEELQQSAIQNCAGVGLDRNPGVALVWITKKYQPFRVSNGVLFQIGEPTELLFFAHGRKATKDEIIESIEGGLPFLQSAATFQGPAAVKALAQQVRAAAQLMRTHGYALPELL